MAALGDRDDWEELRIGSALLLAWSEAYTHAGVHILSGFWGPVERALRDQGANISFAPADFRRFAPLLEQQRPRVMATVATPPDADGWCSLSLHAGGTYAELYRAAADPDRLLVVEVSEVPANARPAPEHRHAVRVDDVDVLIESAAEPFALPEAEPGATDEAIAAHARRFIPDGATLQTGIGTIPSAIVARLAEGDGGDYGVHSEMFTDGLMALHEAGKVTNRKGQFDGVSVATFAAGSTGLYRWLDGNDEVAFLPVEVVNSPDLIGQPDDGDDQRRARGRHPRPGGRGHDRRRPVLGHRRSRGLHLGARALARGPLAALPALDRRDRRRGALPDRPLLRCRRGRYDAAPPGRRDRHRARRGRAAGA